MGKHWKKKAKPADGTPAPDVVWVKPTEMLLESLIDRQIPPRTPYLGRKGLYCAQTGTILREIQKTHPLVSEADVLAILERRQAAGKLEYGLFPIPMGAAKGWRRKR